MLLCQPPPRPVSADVICESPREATDGPRAFHDHSTPPAAAAASPSLLSICVDRRKSIPMQRQKQQCVGQREYWFSGRNLHSMKSCLQHAPLSDFRYRLYSTSSYGTQTTHARVGGAVGSRPDFHRSGGVVVAGGRACGATAAARENIQDQQPETEPIHLSCRRARWGEPVAAKSGGGSGPSTCTYTVAASLSNTASPFQRYLFE